MPPRNKEAIQLFFSWMVFFVSINTSQTEFEINSRRFDVYLV